MDEDLKNKFTELIDIWKDKKENGLISEEQFNKLTDKFKETIADPLNGLTEELKKQNELTNKLPQNPQHVINYSNSYKHFLSEDELKMNMPEEDQRKLGFNRLVKNLYLQHKNQIAPSAQEQMNNYLKTANPFQKHGIQNEGTNADGKYLVPTPTANLLLDDLRGSGLFFSETTQIPMTANTLKMPTIAAGGHPSLAYVAEQGAKAVSNFTIGQIDLSLKKYACLVPWTDELMEDAIADIEALVRQYSSDYFGILTDDILFKGDAQINGLEDMTTTFVTTSSSSFTSATIDNIIDMIGSLRSVDLVNAKFYMTPSVWAMLHKLKASGSGEYLISLAEFNAKTLLGIPVVFTDSTYTVAESGTGKKFITLGNLKKVFVGIKKGIQIAVSNVASFVDGVTTHHSFQENLTVIRIEQRFDMDCAFPTRIVQLKAA